VILYNNGPANGSYTVISGLPTGGDILLRGSELSSLAVHAGNGGNTLRIHDTPFSNTPGGLTTTVSTGTGSNMVTVDGTTGALTLNAQGAADNVFVGTVANPLDYLQGPLTINGQGSTILNVNDQGTSADKIYEVYAGTVKRVLNPGPPRTYDAVINYANIGTLTVSGGSGFDVFYVEGTAAGTNTILNGASGGNAFEVGSGPTGSDSLLGPVAVHGWPGSSFMVYDDALATAAQTYTLTANTISRTGAADVTFDNVYEVILESAIVGGNTINVPSVAAGVGVAFNPANGDTITIGANQTLAAVQGRVQVSPGDNITANVVIDDSSNATPLAGPVTLSNDVTLGFTISGLAPQVIFLSGRQNATLNTTLRTGAGDKTFNVQAAPLGVALTLDAGSGTNTLNYTGLTGNVLANFQTREFTGFSSTSNIQNVIGGQGANILVGDGNESFTGGTGRNIIVSGGGSGQITGGGAGDILIGGTTAYDTDDASLQAILSYWTTSGDDYATRVANLRAGNGVPQLEGGVSVLDNGAANTLTGNGNEVQGIFNLFYVTEAGTVTDPQPNEVVVDIDNPAGAPQLADHGDRGNLFRESLPAAVAGDLYFLHHRDELSGANIFAAPIPNGRTLATDRAHPAIRAADLTALALDLFAPW
jgi:hypothetical protein